jgi:hypothetical protein
MTESADEFLQAIDGEWIEPEHKGSKLACCHCGLVHRVEYRVVRGRVQFRVWRDARATAARRRKLKRPSEAAPDSGWRLTPEQLDAICDRLAHRLKQAQDIQDVQDLVCHLGEVESENQLLRQQK